MSREAALLRNLSKDARIIEVGPSYNPLVPKRDGWNVFTIDHVSREGLIAKYTDNAQVDTSQIEEVDFVWTTGSIADAVPKEQHGTFDAFIASHVIEHTTDMITFLKAAETLIGSDGVIILAVPDKRKCFDLYRYPSSTADAVIAFREKRTRHDTRTHFDYAMRMANKGGMAGWGIDEEQKAVLAVPFSHAEGFLNISQEGAYVDAHNWVFVPASFELILLETAALGLLDLRVEAVEEAIAIEFYAWLRKGAESLTADDIQARRLGLMDRVIVELAEQVRPISSGSSSVV